MAVSSKQSPQALVGRRKVAAGSAATKKAGIDRTHLENIIRGQILFHEQIHDEHVVHREELILNIADAIEAAQKK